MYRSRAPLKWITASDIKNDSADARKLALLARADVQLLAAVSWKRTTSLRLGRLLWATM
jgi:hypothetical protein